MRARTAACPRRRWPRWRRSVREYLAELEAHNPVDDPAGPPPAEPMAAARTVSTTDPDAAWAVKWGRAGFAYF